MSFLYFSKINQCMNQCLFANLSTQVFCTATSVIQVTSPQCVQLVESGEVGIGQLFRYLDRLPTFCLLEVGRVHNGCLWRKYLLSSNELSCLIHEVFTANAWEITSSHWHMSARGYKMSRASPITRGNRCYVFMKDNTHNCDNMCAFYFVVDKSVTFHQYCNWHQIMLCLATHM